MKIFFLPLALALVTLCATITRVFGGGGSQDETPLQDKVDEMRALIGGQTFPDHFQGENPERTGAEFDPNLYFGVLTHLSMEPGYTLDYVYHWDGMGGYPVLYARPLDQPRYLTEAEYGQATGGEADPWLDHVQVDGSEESYFELVLLSQMGRQFYLWWHANYNDATIIADRRGLDAILNTDESFGIEMPAGTKQQARALDLTPVIEIGENTVTVQVIVFTNWGGFYRDTYTIQRAFPHTIIDHQSENLIEYNCGIMF